MRGNSERKFHYHHISGGSGENLARYPQWRVYFRAVGARSDLSFYAFLCFYLFSLFSLCFLGAVHALHGEKRRLASSGKRGFRVRRVWSIAVMRKRRKRKKAREVSSKEEEDLLPTKFQRWPSRLEELHHVRFYAIITRRWNCCSRKSPGKFPLKASS